MVTELRDRPIWVLIPFIFALLPFEKAIREGASAGAGADFVNTIWAMWWFQQEWPFGSWGTTSTLFNFPFGGNGAIISPLNALIWSIIDGILGPNWASTLCSLVLLYSCMILLVWILRFLRFSSLSIGGVLFAFLCQRYFIFTLAETGVVGVAIVPLLLTWLSSLKIREGGGRWWFSLAVFGIAFQGLENPYLAPIPPLIALMVLWGEWKKLVLLGGLSVVLLGFVGFVYHGASASEYQSLRPSYFVTVFGQYFPVVERDWARISFSEIAYPQMVRWPIGGQDTIHQSGRGFLGYSVIFLGGMGLFWARRQGLLLLLLVLIGLLFSFGSDIGGVAAPFAWFNSLCAQLVRPLTQPTRYMILVVLGLSILVGYSFRWFIGKNVYVGIFLWFLIGIEALTFGGLSLRLPTTNIPTASCIQELSQEEGAVLIWPWDGIDDEDFDATLHSRLFQMTHERPAATIGTGSWPLVGQVFPGAVLRKLGWTASTETVGTLDLKTLSEWGYRFVIVDNRVSKTLVFQAKDSIFGSETLVSSCSDFDIYRLSGTTSSKKPVHPLMKIKKP